MKLWLCITDVILLCLYFSGPFSEELFEVTSCYFPIDFTPVSELFRWQVCLITSSQIETWVLKHNNICYEGYFLYEEVYSAYPGWVCWWVTSIMFSILFVLALQWSSWNPERRPDFQSAGSADLYPRFCWGMTVVFSNWECWMAGKGTWIFMTVFHLNYSETYCYSAFKVNCNCPLSVPDSYRYSLLQFWYAHFCLLGLLLT